MNALLIIAHGSRSQTANNEVCQLAKRIDRDSGAIFDRVVHAFLEIAGPQVGTAIDELAAAGAVDIVIFPYFLASGAHVANDIPRVVGEAEKAYPGINFRILPYLGALEGISDLILSHINASVPAR